MTDAERVLAVLIHDVRTPLGVAHGYLRLVRSDKLPSPEDRERALAGTQDALARISRLCQDAGGFLEDPQAGTARASARQLADRVVAVLADRGVRVGDVELPEGSVNVGTSIDRAADAIATLLSLRTGRTPGSVARIEGTVEALRFACGPAAGGTPGAALDGDERPFDPWQPSQGLGVALAHRLITALGGRVWTAGHGLALAVSLPMETGNA
jgi:signal transduction histidine kinase